MSRNIVFEGWLTKSPPNRRIWRTRWRRRWFALRQSGELPGQYFLDYYADRNCRRLKGTIDLDLCEQVDAGLHMERHGQAPLNPNLRGSVFTIQTQRRTYHLEADCEAEMEKWVDAICRVCGLRATEDTPPATSRHNVLLDTYQNNLSAISAMNDHYECADGTGPYIPISECITGVRAQDEQRHFTFEPKSLTMGSRNVGQQYNSQPHIRTNSELSENDSNLSDEDDGSFHASHQNLPDWSVTKSFTKLSVAPRNNGSAEGPPVPPRPPKTFANRNRELPPKDPFQGPKIHEPAEAHDSAQHAQAQHAPGQHAQAQHAPGQHAQAQHAPGQHAQAQHAPGQHAQAPHVQLQHAQTQHPQVQHAQTQHPLTQPPQVQHAQTQHPQVQHAQTQHPQVQYAQAQHAQAQHPQAQHAQAQHPQAQHAQAQHVQPRLWVPRRTSQGAPSSPRPQAPIAQEEEEFAAGHSSMQYCNLPSIPPAVDRALKPRLSTHSVAHVNTVMVQGGLKLAQAEEKSDVLQYLDLDLPTSSSEASGSDPSNPRKKVEIIHGRSSSSADTDAYKTVDFLKTEAFNITRQDAEASRSFQY